MQQFPQLIPGRQAPAVDRPLLMLDLCCGAGGASSAMLERPGWKVIRLDIEPRFSPDIVADLRSWRYSGPPVDLLWASPPCTEFTRWRMRQWYPDQQRPDLSIVAAVRRLVEEIRPRWWVIENVQGAVSFLGPPTQQFPPVYLWGDFPLLLLGGRLTGYKKAGGYRKNSLNKWKQAARRSTIPVELSLALAEAAERAAAVYSPPPDAENQASTSPLRGDFYA